MESLMTGTFFRTTTKKWCGWMSYISFWGKHTGVMYVQKFLKSDELPTHKLMLGQRNLMKQRLLLASTSCIIAACVLRYSRNDDKG
jgi:hypothetical protein